MTNEESIENKRKVSVLVPYKKENGIIYIPSKEIR
jgi:hypothetical protein